jgi:hypothetical protein
LDGLSLGNARSNVRGQLGARGEDAISGLFSVTAEPGGGMLRSESFEEAVAVFLTRKADRVGGGASDDFGGLYLIVMALPVLEAELNREGNFF